MKLKTIALLSLVGLISASSALAQTIPLEAAFDAELLIDYKQTESISHFCDGRVNCTVHETNPMLGKEPTAKGARNYFLTAAVLHGVVTALLPSNDRKPWQVGSIVIEGVVIGRNKHLGLKICW